MAEGWEWRKSLRWSSVRTSESLLVILSAMLKHHTPWRDLSPNSVH